MRPDSSGTTPEMARKSVVFPAPFGPTIATNSPLPTCRSTPSRARNPPYDTRTDSSCSTGRPPLAEIRFDHRRIARHCGWIADCANFAVVEDEQSVGEPHHRMHGVLDDNDRDPSAPDGFHHFEHMLGLRRAEAGKRLVEQQQARPGGERAEPSETHRHIVHGE